LRAEGAKINASLRRCFFAADEICLRACGIVLDDLARKQMSMDQCESRHVMRAKKNGHGANTVAKVVCINQAGALLLTLA